MKGVKRGDKVSAIFYPWDSPYTGRVKEDEQGLYIDTGENSVGYLKHADEIIVLTTELEREVKSVVRNG